MGISLIEQSCISKYENQALCEDGLYIGPAYIAVVDGVTGKGSLKWPGDRSAGRFARDCLLKAIACLPPGLDAAGAITMLNDCLAKACEPRKELLLEKREERPFAAVILYSIKRQEIWSFGDCQCLIDGHFYSHSKRIDDILTEVRCFYNQGELKSGKTTDQLIEEDTGRRLILPLLQRQLLFANGEGEYAYDILDGFPIQADRVVIHRIKGSCQVVLASDGYPCLKETLRESEEYLDYVLKNDPLCISIAKGTKGLVRGNVSFDDRTYVRFDVKV